MLPFGSPLFHRSYNVHCTVQIGNFLVYNILTRILRLVQYAKADATVCVTVTNVMITLGNLRVAIIGES